MFCPLQIRNQKPGLSLGVPSRQGDNSRGQNLKLTLNCPPPPPPYRGREGTRGAFDED